MAEVVTIAGGVARVLGDIGSVSDLTWTHAWPYLCLEASWSIDLPPNTAARALQASSSTDVRVEIWDGPVRVWVGYLSEVNPGAPWECHALGWYAAFSNLLALDSTPSPTAIPSVAVTEAISRAGLPITVGSTLQSTSITSADETVDAQFVSALMEAYTAEAGLRWGVDENYVLTVAADPTEPYYIYDSLNALRGNADDDYITDIYPRYVSGVDVDGNPNDYDLGHVATASQPAGRRERPMDVTSRGIMTGPTANALAQGQLDLNGARFGYTAGIEAAFGEVLRLGGSPARLGLMKPGRVLRSFNVADASGQPQVGLTADVVIGRTVYTDGASTIRLDPLGLAARTFTATLEALKTAEPFDGTAA